MPLWLQVAFMAMTAVGVLTAGLVSLFTYLRVGETHKLVDSTRQDANKIVSTVAYIQGRQDAVFRLVEGKLEVNNGNGNSEGTEGDRGGGDRGGGGGGAGPDVTVRPPD